MKGSEASDLKEELEFKVQMLQTQVRKRSSFSLFQQPLFDDLCDQRLWSLSLNRCKRVFCRSRRTSPRCRSAYCSTKVLASVHCRLTYSAQHDKRDNEKWRKHTTLWCRHIDTTTNGGVRTEQRRQSSTTQRAIERAHCATCVAPNSWSRRWHNESMSHCE
jgi:hypothetical protein